MITFEADLKRMTEVPSTITQTTTDPFVTTNCGFFFFFCIIKKTNANFKLFLLDIRTTSTEHSVSKGHFCSFHPFSWWHGKSMAKLFDLKSHRSCSTNCILFCLRKKNQNINCAKSQRYVLVRGTITHRQRNIMLYWLNM